MINDYAFLLIACKEFEDEDFRQRVRDFIIRLDAVGNVISTSKDHVLFLMTYLDNPVKQWELNLKLEFGKEGKRFIVKRVRLRMDNPNFADGDDPQLVAELLKLLPKGRQS